MNKERRKRIKILIQNLHENLAELDDIMYDEEEYLNNIPDNLQGSERYEKAEEYCDILNESYDNLLQVITSLQEIE